MFKQIVVVDKTRLQNWAIERLQTLSEKPVLVFENDPINTNEILERIKDADCVFVSYKTQLSSEILSQCTNLKYIGMCCSLYDSKSANVDIDFAFGKGIVVKGIRDYGDEGLVEYIISELIRLIKGIGNHQWKPEPVELANRKIGIIGLGATGRMLANLLHAFGAEVFYFSRNRKPDAELAGIKYLSLDELLITTEIISLHLPKKTNILKSDEFKKFGNGKILINTSLGLTFDKSAFESWILHDGNFAIFDSDGVGIFKEEFAKYDNVLSTNVVSGWTHESEERLSRKVLNNVNDYIENSGS